MHLSDYQRLATQTRVIKKDSSNALIVSLLGLAGETGSLLTEFKKHYRDGSAYRLFSERLIEELGDVLWYLADIADQNGISLEAVAKANIDKIHRRWRVEAEHGDTLFPLHERFFDEDCLPAQQLPRKARFVFREEGVPENPTVLIHLNDAQQVGDPLTDNSHDKDGYRFHDVFHITYATILNWSPITRANLNRKRRFPKELDENEDGGRAGVIEEAISAIVFEYARGHSFLEGVKTVDYELLRLIAALTSPFEVRRCSVAQWEQAIVVGFAAWRQVFANRGGAIICDAIQKSVVYERETSDGNVGGIT